MRRTTRRRRTTWWIWAFAVFVVLAAFVTYSFVEPFRVETKQLTIADPDVPAAFDGTRIVLLTDIHRGWFFSEERVGRLVDRINALEPDMVVLGGDYVYVDSKYQASCFRELARLEAPLGRFAVLGNHDYGDYEDGSGGPAPAIRAIEGAGITLLRDEAVWVEKDGSRLRIGGVSDYQVDVPRLAPTLEGTEEGDFILLISHNPDFAEELPAGAVDLVLSGHTHGGQITFFGLWAPYLPSDYGQKYRSGLVETDATTVIVSNGVGSSIILPIRFFARPQIVEITLRSGGG